MFKEHDSIILKSDFKEFKKGTSGVIVFVCSSEKFWVEFFDNEHNTIGVETVSKDKLIKI